MPLVDFQAALGRLVRVPVALEGSPIAADRLAGLALSPGERAQVQSMADEPGFRFTISVQRSWCESRAAMSALQTLSLLTPAMRRSLLTEWVDRGGGVTSFFAGEAEAFLEFIASHLPNPSHALSLCRLEQAVHRTSPWTLSFEPPQPSLLDRTGMLLRAGAHAALVPIFVAPEDLLSAVLAAAPLPPQATPLCHLLFAPGLPRMFRLATPAETELWAQLARVEAMHAPGIGHEERAVVAELLAIGAIDVVQPPTGSGMKGPIALRPQ